MTIWNYVTPVTQQAVTKIMPALPNNYIVATHNYIVSTYTYEVNRSGQEEIRAAEHLVQCAPRSSWAWRTLAQQYSRTSEHVRAARVASDITPQEWKVLNRIYARQLSAAQQAASLDPQSGQSWRDVAVAATFAGKTRLADNAMQKALRLSKGDARVYTWGMQMYQPKWLDDAAKLDKVVKLALADHELSADGRRQVAQALQELGRDGEANSLLTQPR